MEGNYAEKFLTVLAGLLQGAGVTVMVTVGAFVLAVLIGFALALLLTFVRNPVVTALAKTYVEIFRNIPALAHLFILYFGLASVGINMSSLMAAILGLGLIYGAVLTDVFRAGFKAIHIGQWEAGLAVGMTPAGVLRLVAFPQAMRVALPSLGNAGVQLLKDTSIVAAIAAPEIMFYARNMVTSTFETTLIYLTAAGLYLVLAAPILWGVSRLEARATPGASS